MTTKPNKQIEVWLRTSGWGIPRKVGIAAIRTDAPSTLRNLAGLLRKIADTIEPLGGQSNAAE